MLEHLSDIYSKRFTSRERERKTEIWKILVSEFFQKYVPVRGVVLDLGSGHGEFINNIIAQRRIAIDLNPESADLMAPGVEFLETPSTNLSQVVPQSVDTVFTSNFFEHLPDADSLIATLKECRRVLKVDGTLVVMMPNIKYVKEDFWDYLDHSLPLSDRSMLEALEIARFAPLAVFPRFLPYTIKHRKHEPPLFLLRIYLKARWLWPIFGKQMLITARPRSVDAE